MKAYIAIANKDIPGTSIRAGEQITLTKGVRYKYALWHKDDIFDLPAIYVKKGSAERFDRVIE